MGEALGTGIGSSGFRVDVSGSGFQDPGLGTWVEELGVRFQRLELRDRVESQSTYFTENEAVPRRTRI